MVSEFPKREMNENTRRKSAAVCRGKTGGDMVKQGSARKNILMIMALSYGVMDRSIGLEICGGNRNGYRGTLEYMYKKDEAETIFGVKPRVLHIKKNGIDAIAKDILFASDFYEKGYLWHQKDRDERYAMISRALYDLQLADVIIDPGSKGVFRKENGIAVNGRYRAFAPIEYKAENKKEIQACRAHALVTGNGKMFFVYAAGSKNIRYRKSTERKIHEFMINRLEQPADVSDIFLVDDYSFAEKVLQNDQTGRIMEKNHRVANLITSDMDGYIVPSRIGGSPYLKMVLYPEIADSLLKLARAQSDCRVVSALPLSLRTCRQIQTGQDEMTVLCTDEMKDIIDRINSGSNIHKLKIKKTDLERYVRGYFSLEEVQ